MVELKFNDYIELKYKYTGEFHEGLAIVKNNEDEFGFIDKKGKEVIKCKYHDVKNFSEGLAAVQNDKNLWGYINQQGEEIIPCKYLNAKDFSEGLAVVKTNLGNYVYIDKNDIQIIGYEYTFASSFFEGYALVKHKGSNLYNYLDKNSHHNGRYLSATSFQNGKAIVMDDEYIYIIDKSFQPKFLKKLNRESISKAILCNNGYTLIVDDNGYYGFLNTDFEKITPISFLNAREFHQENAIVEISNDFIGFINDGGKITAFSKYHQYKEINDFSEGLAAVQNVEGLWGYINPEGKEVIPCQFKQADNFSEGLAGVMDKEGSIYYIDKKGKKIISIDKVYYSSIELLDKTITIKANSPQELAAEKLRVISLAKYEIIAATINMIDQIAYTESSGLYKPQTRKRTNKKGNKKKEN